MALSNSPVAICPAALYITEAVNEKRVQVFETVFRVNTEVNIMPLVQVIVKFIFPFVRPFLVYYLIKPNQRQYQ